MIASDRLSDDATSNTELARLFLDNVPSTGWVDHLKIRFRPYICPYNLLLSFVEPDSSYFDIGCGSGMFLRILAEYKHPTALGGVEISDRLIQNARSILQRCSAPVELNVYDGARLPPHIEQYEYLFMIDVLHHLRCELQLAFLESLFKRMQPGQRLLLKDIDANSPLVYWNKVHDLVLSREVGHELRAESVGRELERIGFQVQFLFKKRVFLYPHFGYLCRKPHSKLAASASTSVLPMIG